MHQCTERLDHAQNAGDIEHFLATLREGPVGMEDMEIRRAELEDVFLQVMKGAP